MEPKKPVLIDSLFRTLADESPNMIFINQDGRIRYVNKSCVVSMGYTEEEFLSESFNFLDLIAPEDKDKVQRNYEIKRKGGKLKAYEYNLITKSKERISVIINSKMIDFEGGKALLGLVTDISERKAFETELKVSKERLENLFFHMNDAIIVHGLDGTILDVNHKATRMLGYTEDELLSMKIENLHPKDASGASKEAFRKIKEDGHVRFEIDFIDKNKRRMVCEVSASFMDHKGVSIIQGIVRDITKEKAAKAIIEKNLLIEKTISKISSRFLRSGDFDQHIDMSLRDLGVLSGAGRSYLFLVDGKAVNNTNEWCQDEVSPEIDNLQNLRKDDYEWWFRNLEKGIIHIPDVSTMHEDGCNEKKILESQGIKSLIVLPIKSKDGIKGFLGFDNVTSSGVWDERIIYLLRIAADIISNAIERNAQEEENIRLHETLKRYAKRLEVKVKKFDKDIVNLTSKEKRVIAGMAVMPDLNDRELSLKIGINRSTITAIRNRLRSQGLFQFINVPNLRLFGKELMTVIYGRFDKSFRFSGRYKDTFNHPSFVYTLITDDHFLTVLISENLVDFHRIVDPLLALGARYNFYKETPDVVHFPFVISKFSKVLDFSDLISDLLDQDMSKDMADLHDAAGMRLTKNLKEVLKGAVQYPEITTVELAKRLGLTRATVTNKQNLLVEKGLIRKVMIPDLNKLSCELLVILHLRYNPSIDKDERGGLISLPLKKNDVFAVENDSEGIIIKVFCSQEEYKDHMKSLMPVLRSTNIIIGDPVIVPVPLDNVKFRNINFSGFTIHALNP